MPVYDKFNHFLSSRFFKKGMKMKINMGKRIQQNFNLSIEKNISKWFIKNILSLLVFFMMIYLFIMIEFICNFFGYTLLDHDFVCIAFAVLWFVSTSHMLSVICKKFK